MESKITEYLKENYDPEVIVLAGSRAKGRETDKSDWDLFLLGQKKGNGGFIKFEEQLLDITFKNWPEENKALNIPSGPIWPMKILLDKSNGKFAKVLEATDRDYSMGPLFLYKNRILERYEMLKRWITKIERFKDEPMVEFLYAGVFYEIVIRVWFELRNEWSVSTAEALEYIKEKDIKFHQLLRDFVSADSIKRSEVANALFDSLTPPESA